MEQQIRFSDIELETIQKIWNWLCEQFGANCYGTEIRLGTRVITRLYSEDESVYSIPLSVLENGTEVYNKPGWATFEWEGISAWLSTFCDR